MKTIAQLRTTDNGQQTTVPPCPHFGACGGCQLQHLAYAVQLELKSARLGTLLAATNLTLPELQLHPSPPLGYRNRIRLTLAEAGGQLRAGYLRTNESVISTEGGASAAAVEKPALSLSKGLPHFAREADSSRASFLPITQCPIAASILWRATESLLALLNQAPTLWLRSPQFQLDQLELFAAADESALQFTLYLRTAAKSPPTKLTSAFTALCEALRADTPELTGAGIAILPPLAPNRSRRTETTRPGPTWGAPGLNYTVGASSSNAGTADSHSAAEDRSVILSTARNLSRSALPQPTDNQQATTYWVPRTAFFQINRFLLPELLALVTANRTGDLAFDLYAGVGLFSRALARSFARVTAVEIAEPACSALAATKLANLSAVQATTVDFLRTAVIDRDRPSLIVLDPPRTGAGPEICALLARLASPTLVYVSCSAEHLASDLQTLAASGYAVAALHLLDLFPQTTHIETVAILTR